MREVRKGATCQVRLSEKLRCKKRKLHKYDSIPKNFDPGCQKILGIEKFKAFSRKRSLVIELGICSRKIL